MTFRSKLAHSNRTARRWPRNSKKCASIPLIHVRIEIYNRIAVTIRVFEEISVPLDEFVPVASVFVFNVVGIK